MILCPSLTNTSPCAQHSEAKQYQNFGVWSRGRFIAGPCKERGGSCLKKKKTQTPRKPSAKPFYRKGEGGARLFIANYLVSDPLFLKSGHGQVTMFLYISTKQMLFFVLTRKGKVPRLNLLPPRSKPGLGGGGPLAGWLPEGFVQHPARLTRQLSAGGTLRARSPDPAQPSPLREPDAQDPAGPQAPKAAQTGAGVLRLGPLETATVIRSQRWGEGRGSLPPQGLGPASARPRRGLWNPAGHSPQPAPGPPSSPTGPRPQGLEGPRDNAENRLSPRSAPRTTTRPAAGKTRPLTASH